MSFLSRQGEGKERKHTHTQTGEIRKVQKNIYFCFIGYTKTFDCVENNKLRKILKEMGGKATSPDLSPEKPVCRSRSNS